MAGGRHLRLERAWNFAAHSLSGRLLLLTLLYVLVSEVVIFVPTIGRYHRSLLDNHIESAELAILPFTEAGGEKLSMRLRTQLLMRAGATAVMLKRPEQSELFLMHAMPGHIDASIDLRGSTPFGDMAHALDCIFMGGDRVLHIISGTKISGAQTVEVIVGESTIRAALLDYAERALLVALGISIVAAILVFVSLYLIFVRPMGRITQAMLAFRENPEDPARIMAVSARPDEIGVAERELSAMQRDIYGFLQQRARLAALGTAVAKIQHDLRNILASAQLASDRLAASEDPAVQKLAPRLIGAIDHAVALATNTLRYGRADEHPPKRRRIAVRPLADEAGQTAIATKSSGRTVQFENRIEALLEADADPEQLFRILLNLVGNAVEAVAQKGGEVSVSARRAGDRLSIDIADSGPGIPEAVRARLFQPFAGTGRPDGSGLGLAIARELARAHGGDVVLVKSDASGTRFRIEIPDREDK